VLYSSIILEVKTVDCFNNSHYNQCLNYLKVSDNELALLVNFNSVSLEYKRIVRTKKSANLRLSNPFYSKYYFALKVLILLTS